jgi:hypothetical protein
MVNRANKLKKVKMSGSCLPVRGIIMVANNLSIPAKILISAYRVVLEQGQA